MELVDGAATMALTGRGGGPPVPGLSGRRLREVLYVQVVPNLLISAHHRL